MIPPLAVSVPESTESDLPTATAAETRHSLYRLARRHRGHLALAAAVSGGATVAGLAVPAVLGGIVDAVLDGDRGRIDPLVLVLAVVSLASAALSGWAGVLVARVGEHAVAELREQVVERALELPLTAIEQAGTGDIVARVGADVDAVADGVRRALPELSMAAFDIVLTLVALWLLDWRLAFALLAVVPGHVVVTRWYLRRSWPLYGAARRSLGEQAGQLAETMQGADTVRALRLSRHHGRLVERASATALARTMAAARLRSVFSAAVIAAEVVGMATVLTVAFVAVRAGTVSAGAATAAALYFHRLFDVAGGLLGVLDTSQVAGAALARLVGVTQLPACPAASVGATVPSEPDLELRGVHFAYEAGHDVLHGLDLVVAAGERLALVGTSGAGKTTIGRLVAGVHRPDGGVVRIAGMTHDELGPAARRTVHLVNQEVHVFAGPLADDLRLVSPAASDAALMGALETVGAAAWVAQLPAGLATVVGEGGHRLTPTQAQQVALARLALAGAPVAVLDEATAEAGSAGGYVLERAAHAVTRGRTTLVIAHRLTQAATADRIAVVDGGRIVEAGTHDELAAGDGPYSELWTTWTAGHPSKDRTDHSRRRVVKRL